MQEKYLHVNLLSLILISGEIISLCPGENKDLFCSGPGEVIVFQSASWGMRSRSSVCGTSPPPQDQCSSNITLSMLTANCFRQSVCSINHDGVSTYFRDPCSVDYTELIINYLCVPSKDNFLSGRVCWKIVTGVGLQLFQKQVLEDIGYFSGATDAPILNFW